MLQRQNLPVSRLVVFGDQINDGGMFRMADEAYAVAGAVPDLSQHATAVIGSNDDDAVARWLDAHWRCYAPGGEWREKTPAPPGCVGTAVGNR